MVADRWLCVESRAAWGRDALAEGGFSPSASAWLEVIDASVLTIRRPSRREGPTVAFAANSREGGGELRVLEVCDPDELVGSDPWSEGTVVATTLFLVCTHGRRDPCCARLGVPIFTALDRVAESVWQCSHTGGHRFAPNVVALPWGVTLGRVLPDEVAELALLLRDGRVPLERYRGRSVYPAHVQAAEVAVRLTYGIDRLDDLQLAELNGEIVTFATVGGNEIAMRVKTREGLVLPKSCGKDVEQLFTFSTEEIT